MNNLLYTTWTVDGSDYKLYLSARGTIELENKYKKPWPEILQGITSLETLLNVIWASFKKYHPDITFDDIIDLYDNYLAGGGSYEDVVNMVKDVLTSSGFLKREIPASPTETVETPEEPEETTEELGESPIYSSVF